MAFSSLFTFPIFMVATFSFLRLWIFVFVFGTNLLFSMDRETKESLKLIEQFRAGGEENETVLLPQSHCFFDSLIFPCFILRDLNWKFVCRAWALGWVGSWVGRIVWIVWVGIVWAEWDRGFVSTTLR